MMRKNVSNSKIDPDFKFKIAKTYEGKTVLWCVQCGMCTSGCPYAEMLDEKPHEVIKKILLGMKSDVINSKFIWLCSTCFMCDERCPQGVELGRVMFALKNLAAKERGAPESYKLFGKQVMSTGRSTNITVLRKKEREKIGLPKIPKIDSECMSRMLRKVKLDEFLNNKKEG